MPCAGAFGIVWICMLRLLCNLCWLVADVALLLLHAGVYLKSDQILPFPLLLDAAL
jgi:hypothetical protein